ncbi:UDPglucose 6-dehydrogenase [Xanthomonas arboricola]|nr:UDPglucose 6-dehydrogenase [Xanthomonas cannabis]
MRAASSHCLMAQPSKAGASVRASDPEAAREARRIFGGRNDLTFCDEAFAAPEGADALVLVTGWKQFRSLDFGKIRQAVKDEVVFDGRNLHDRKEIDAAGLAYYAIGRGRSLHA